MKTAAASLKSAGSLIAKQAERTTLVTVTLPRAYAELGKASLKDSHRRDEFKELAQSVSALVAERKKTHDEVQARSAGTTMAEKAKKAVADAASLARTKAIDLKVYQALARLGQAVYEKYGDESGPVELTGPIAKAIARREQLDQETANINERAKGKWFTPKRIVWGGGALIVCLLIGSAVSGRGARKSGSMTSVSESASGKAASQLPPLIGESRTDREVFPGGEQKREDQYVGKVPHGYWRSWYSNGVMRDDVTMDRGAMVSGTYWSRGGKVIYAFDNSSRNPRSLATQVFAAGPDGQSLEARGSKESTDLNAELRRQQQEEERQLPNTVHRDTRRELPPRDALVSEVSASVYVDEDYGECPHGLLKWSTAGGIEGTAWSTDKAITAYNGKGSVMCVGGRRHGPVEAFYPSGKRRLTGQYVHNVPHGKFSVWSEGGQLVCEWYFYGGLKEGEWQEWYENGKKSRIQHYSRDKRHGPARHWYETGEVYMDENWLNGLKEGKSTKWHKNGQLMEQAEYIAGQLQGIVKTWSREGAELPEEFYEKGKLQCPKASASNVYKEGWLSGYEIGKRDMEEILSEMEKVAASKKERSDLLKLTALINRAKGTRDQFQESYEMVSGMEVKGREVGAIHSVNQQVGLTGGRLDGYLHAVGRYLMD